MLDTDTVSYALRGIGGVSARLLDHKPSEICVSAITVAELRFGADKRRSQKLHGLIDRFTSSVDVVPFGAEAAALFGSIAADLAARGVPIGDFDVLIAAHALATGAILVTNNAKHFERVKALRTENWV